MSAGGKQAVMLREESQQSLILFPSEFKVSFFASKVTVAALSSNSAVKFRDDLIARVEEVGGLKQQKQEKEEGETTAASTLPPKFTQCVSNNENSNQQTFHQHRLQINLSPTAIINPL